jgi:hypothetical protein
VWMVVAAEPVEPVERVEPVGVVEVGAARV